MCCDLPATRDTRRRRGVRNRASGGEEVGSVRSVRSDHASVGHYEVSLNAYRSTVHKLAPHSQILLTLHHLPPVSSSSLLFSCSGRQHSCLQLKCSFCPHVPYTTLSFIMTVAASLPAKCKFRYSPPTLDTEFPLDIREEDVRRLLKRAQATAHPRTPARHRRLGDRPQ